MRRVQTWFLIAACLSAAHAADVPEDAVAGFSRAVQLLNAGHYAEAVPLLKDVTNRVPQSSDAFWNLGLAAALSGDQDLALQGWSHYHELRPDDPKGFFKLIQTHQALGQLSARDQVRERLIAHRNALPANEREKLAFFVRDQFDVAGQHFMVIEYFEPKSPNRLYYKFDAVDRSHIAIYNFTLASGDAETAVARELGRIGKDDRLYGLDKNEAGKSTLYGLMTSRPTYDEVRSRVIEVMEGKSALRLPAVFYLVSFSHKEPANARVHTESFVIARNRFL